MRKPCQRSRLCAVIEDMIPSAAKDIHCEILEEIAVLKVATVPLIARTITSQI